MRTAALQAQVNMELLAVHAVSTGTTQVTDALARRKRGTSRDAIFG